MTHTRLPRALLVVVVTIALELALWELFVRRSYWRQFFLPVSLAVAFMGLGVLLRTLRSRNKGDRRDADRRQGARRHDRDDEA